MSSPAQPSSLGQDAPALTAALAAFPEPMLVLDRRDRVSFANDATAALLGCGAQQLLGSDWSALFRPLLTANARRPADGAWQALAGAAAEVVQARVRPCAGGTVVSLHTHRSVGADADLRGALEAGMGGAWSWNAATDELTGAGCWPGRLLADEHHRCLGADLLSLVHPDDIQRLRTALVDHLRGAAPHFECDMRLPAADTGDSHWLVRGQVVARADSGRALHVSGSCQEVTLLKRRDLALSQALESGMQAIWEWDATEDRFNAIGEWQPALVGLDLSWPMAGIDLAERFHPEDRERAAAAVRDHLAGRSDQIEVEARMRRLDGGWAFGLVRGRACEHDHDGRVLRVIGTFTDLTALRNQEQRLQIALESARQGLWEWEPDTDRLEYSREWYDLFGYPPGTITSHRVDMQTLLHPDAIAPGRAAIVPMLLGERDNFEVHHKIRHADGHYLDVLSRGRVLERGRDGRVKRVVGTHVDVTDYTLVHTELARSRQFLETVIDSIPQRVFWKDRDSRYVGCNRRFAEEAGLASPQAIVGRYDEDMPWRDIAETVRADDQLILSGEEDSNVRVRLLDGASGHARWVETTKTAIRDSEGGVVGVLGSYNDVTARLARERELEAVAGAFTGARHKRVLNALCESAADLASADCAFVAQIDPNDPARARVTAHYPYSSDLDGLVYPLAGSPCALTIRQDDCFVEGEIASQFPDDPLLRQWDMHAYAGRRLLDNDGRVIGLMVLLFREPALEPDEVTEALKVFAARATAELERETIHEMTRASDERLNAAIEGSSQTVFEWYSDTDRITLIGPGPANGQVKYGRQLLELLHEDDRDVQRRALASYFRGQASNYEYEARFRGADGSWRWLLTRGHASEFRNGRVSKMVGAINDITDLKQAQTELLASRRFLELLVDTVPTAIFWQDRNFVYVGCNEQFAEFAHVDSPQDIVGRRNADLWWGDDTLPFENEDRALLAGETSLLRGERRLAYRDGSNRWVDIQKVPMLNERGDIVGILGSIHDITTRRVAEEDARRLARFDPLTDLPNRRYFTGRLEGALASAKRRSRVGALLFIDLDQFKNINDTLGHAVGDALLQAVAERLQNVTRQEDTVARLGGDEFVVLLPDIADSLERGSRQARLVADKIHESLGHTFQFDHNQIHITPTIGITLFPEDSKTADDVLKEADTAMYSGKADGRGVTRFFLREMEESAQRRLRIEAELRQAISGNELTLHFQPQVDRSGAITGAEALLRWQHPVRGMVPPGEFIPVAEERGLMGELGRWVFNAALGRLKVWVDRGVDFGDLAINVSSHQFRAADFVADVEKMLVEHRVPPHRVVFEITESTVIEDVEATIEIMRRLRRVGIRFAIDDFGVGYSSLSYLKRLPIDQLKIDRSFIADIGSDQNDEIICQTIIAMSQHLRLETIAEGVETEEQFNFLNRLRCTGYQGYLIMPPVPEDEFLAFCDRHGWNIGQ